MVADIERHPFLFKISGSAPDIGASISIESLKISSANLFYFRKYGHFGNLESAKNAPKSIFESQKLFGKVSFGKDCKGSFI